MKPDQTAVLPKGHPLEQRYTRCFCCPRPATGRVRITDPYPTYYRCCTEHELPRIASDEARNQEQASHAAQAIQEGLLPREDI